MSFTVAIYVFPKVEVLDFTGPYEVFTTATRIHRRRHPDSDPKFQVFTVAQTTDPVTARAGLKVIPDFAVDSAPRIDVLVVPGGVVDAELGDPAVISWVRDRSGQAAITASICTGAFILAKAGLLKGKSATTHWEDTADLRSSFPDTTVVEGVRWVDEGSIISSAGIAAGIDMSLHLVSRLAGEPLAIDTARQLDVPHRVSSRGDR
jgi:transcriptional regulator GlxA family with amidase domain